jgi:DNA-binding NarL/FixJ family response regulator
LRNRIFTLVRRIGLRERRGAPRAQTIVSVVRWTSADWPRELTVAIATDDQARQSSLRQAFVCTTSDRVRALASPELKQLADIGPDAVVIDSPCTFADQVKLTGELSRLPGAPAVIVVGAQDADLGLAVATLGAGAGGLLPRTATDDELREAVACVLRGEAVVPPAVAAHVVRALQEADHRM